MGAQPGLAELSDVITGVLLREGDLVMEAEVREKSLRDGRSCTAGCEDGGRGPSHGSKNRKEDGGEARSGKSLGGHPLTFHRERVSVRTTPHLLSLVSLLY